VRFVEASFNSAEHWRRFRCAKAFDRFTWALKNKDWVVYAKKPFAGPTHVIRYLAHYTHRMAIANGRLLHFENGQVTFRGGIRHTATNRK